MRYGKTPDYFDWWMFPVRAATVNNQRKAVRVIGAVFSSTVMLPWTVVAFFSASAAAAIGTALMWVIEWFEEI